MKSWTTIQNELQELNSTLPAQKLPDVYAVPEGYFENFAQTVLQKIKGTAFVSEELEGLSPLLAGLSRKMPFSVPEGYFNQISESIPAIAADESLPPILIKAGKSMPYKVPAGYFNELSSVILKKISTPKEKAKVISIGSRNWMRYAAAAMIAGVITISSIMYFGKTKTIDPSVQSGEWVAKQLKNVSNQELEEFINTADINATAIAQNEKNGNTEIQKLLKDVPDAELEKFLNELPMDQEIGMN